MNDLVALLSALVTQTGIPQVLLADMTGLSEKHISQMLNHGMGSTDAWSALLAAAGVTVGEPTP